MISEHGSDEDSRQQRAQLRRRGETQSINGIEQSVRARPADSRGTIRNSPTRGIKGVVRRSILDSRRDGIENQMKLTIIILRQKKICT
jgi:hypothetical protein